MVFPFPSEEPLVSYYNVGCAVIWPTLTVWTKRDWRGQEHLGVPGQGIVVASNHLSWFDPLLLLHYSNDADRPARFMAKDSLFEIPVVGTVMSGAGTIPVHRRARNASEAVESAVQAVKDGQAVWVYPEGTITRDPELWPMRAKTGAARIALLSDAPLIPVAHWGVQKIMGPYQKELNLFPRKTVHVVTGPPINLDDLRGKPVTEELLQIATNRLMDTITAMLARIRRETPPEDRWDSRFNERRPVERNVTVSQPTRKSRKKSAAKRSPAKKTVAKKASPKKTAAKKAAPRKQARKK